MKVRLLYIIISLQLVVCLGQQAALEIKGDQEQYITDFGTPVLKSKLPKGLDRSKQWYALELIQPVNSRDNVLEFLDFRIDDISVAVPNGDGFKVYHTGVCYSFSSRPINHKNFVFELPDIHSEVITIYLSFGYCSGLKYTKRAKIKSFVSCAEYGFMEYAFLLFFYGVIIAMGFYNLIRFLFTKDDLHLYYFFYVSTIVLFGLARIDGLGFQLIWPNLPVINSFIYPLSMDLFVTMSAVFAFRFLKLKDQQPKVFYGIAVWLFIRALIVLLGFAFSFYPEFKPLDLAVLAVLVVVGFKQQKTSLLFSSYFLLGFSCMFLGFLAYSMQELNVIVTTQMNYYGLNLGVLLETLLLSLAISDKTKQVLIDKQKAQKEAIKEHQKGEKLLSRLVAELKEKELLKDKVNRELEDKVAQRTTELHAKNQELGDLNEELESKSAQILKMNEQLDLLNYRLKQENKEMLTASISAATLDREKIHEIYPDRNRCLQFLKNKKWKEGFVCRKCGNEKHQELTNLKGKRCTKCGTSESLTANTLFEKQRVPLEKAFFIAYEVFQKQSQVKAPELAEYLGLGTKTCFNFIKKCSDRKREFGDKGRITWEQFILK